MRDRHYRAVTPSLWACPGCGEPIIWLYCDDKCEAISKAKEAKKPKQQAKQKQLTLWSE